MKEMFRTMWNLMILLRDDRAVTTQSAHCVDKLGVECDITIKRLKNNTITIKLVPTS